VLELITCAHTVLDSTTYELISSTALEGMFLGSSFEALRRAGRRSNERSVQSVDDYVRNCLVIRDAPQSLSECLTWTICMI